MSGRYREFDEEKALKKAADVFWLKGYEAASTEDLLQAMDLNKGSMYNAFGNKRELFLKVFHWFAEQFIRNMQETFRKHTDPTKAIKEIFFGVARTVDPIQHAKGCFYVNILGEMSGMDEDLVKIARKNLLDVEALFYREINRGIDEGYIGTVTTPKALAKYLVNLWNGMSISRRLYSRKDLEMLVEMNLKVLNKS